MKSLKIAIADDHKLFRKGLAEIIESDPTYNYKVVLEADSGISLLDQLKTITPDVVLLDLKMPGMDGMETTNIIKATYPNLRIIILSMFDDDKFIYHLVKLGVNGYLLKNAEPQELLEAISKVTYKDFYMTETVADAMARGIKTNNNKIPSIHNKVKLSNRELEVLELICKGNTNAEIAKILFLATRTVEGHRQRIIDKTGVRNTADLVAYAFKNNIIQI